MAGANLFRDIASLPPEAQRQVADYVALLKLRRRRRLSSRRAPSVPIANEPFVGMWREREEMQDSAAWVRQLREGDWNSGK
jgi:hypothetical protein